MSCVHTPRVFLRHAREVVGQLGDADAHGVEGVDIQRLFFSLTLDSICEIAFGVNVDSMHHPAHPFAKAFDSAQVRPPPAQHPRRIRRSGTQGLTPSFCPHPRV